MIYKNLFPSLSKPFLVPVVRTKSCVHKKYNPLLPNKFPGAILPKLPG